MDKELKSKWVAALRSGEYKQGRMTLVRPQSKVEGKPWSPTPVQALGRSQLEFCCLGVLGCVLGIPVEKMAGRAYIVGSVYSGVADVPFGQELFARMNDEGRFTFDRIADYIEAKQEL